MALSLIVKAGIGPRPLKVGGPPPCWPWSTAVPWLSSATLWPQRAQAGHDQPKTAGAEMVERIPGLMWVEPTCRCLRNVSAPPRQLTMGHFGPFWTTFWAPVDGNQALDLLQATPPNPQSRRGVRRVLVTTATTTDPLPQPFVYYGRHVTIDHG